MPALNAKHESGGVAALALSGVVRRFCPARTPPASIIKPNELAYRQAQGIYQPSECVIVGDDKRLDIDVPKSLGFKTIYVNENGDIKRVEELSLRLIKKL